MSRDRVEGPGRRAHLDCLDEMLMDLVTQRWQAMSPPEIAQAMRGVCLVVQASPDEAQRRWWMTELTRSLQQAFPDAKLFPSSIKMNLAIMLRSAQESYAAWRDRYAPPLLAPERN